MDANDKDVSGKKIKWKISLWAAFCSICSLWFLFSSKYINFSTPSALIIYLCRTSFVPPILTHPAAVSYVGHHSHAHARWTKYLKKFPFSQREGEIERERSGKRSVFCSLKQFMHVMCETESDRKIRKCLNVVLILVQIQMHKCGDKTEKWRNNTEWMDCAFEFKYRRRKKKKILKTMNRIRSHTFLRYPKTSHMHHVQCPAHTLSRSHDCRKSLKCKF